MHWLLHTMQLQHRHYTYTHTYVWMRDTHIRTVGNCREVVLYIAEVLHEWLNKHSLIKAAVYIVTEISELL